MTEHDALIGIVAICAIFLFVGYVAYVDHAAEKYGRYQERKRWEKMIRAEMEESAGIMRTRLQKLLRQMDSKK